MSSQEQEYQPLPEAGTPGSFASAVEELDEVVVTETPLNTRALFVDGANSFQEQRPPIRQPQRLPSYFLRYDDDDKSSPRLDMNEVEEEKEEDRIFADDSSVESAEDAQELFLSTEQSIEDRLCHTEDVAVPFTDENGIRGLDPDAPAEEWNLPKPPETGRHRRPRLKGEKKNSRASITRETGAGMPSFRSLTRINDISSTNFLQRFVLFQLILQRTIVGKLTAGSSITMILGL